MQVVPQLPQFARSFSRSTQTPPHGNWFRGHWHLPATQAVPPVQAMPHAPQFLGSTRVSTQELPHAFAVAAHDCAQTPAAQTSPILQLVPHAPQLRGSLVVLTHWPPHAVWPEGHWHLPATQAV